MTTAALLRIRQDLKELQNSKYTGIRQVILNPDNQYDIQIIINGPIDSPYAKGKFKLKFQMNNSYPFDPPKVKFVNKIYHPNIDTDGNICLDIIKLNWNPIQTILSIVISIISLLSDPSPEDPLNQEAGELYLRNQIEFVKLAEKWAKIYSS